MKDIAFVKPGIYRLTLWYDICKENYIHYLLMLMVRFAMQGLCLLWLPIFCSVSFACKSLYTKNTAVLDIGPYFGQ